MGKIKSTLKSIIEKSSLLYYPVFRLRDLQFKLKSILLGDKKLIERKYKSTFGREIHLDNPKTLNEKIQWLKLYCRKDFHTIVADKYAAREWLAERFGDEYLIPLLFTTTDYRDLKPENIPDVPCIIKANHGAGMSEICRDKNLIDWKKLREKFRVWLKRNYYYGGQEWQYKNIKPRIIVEKLLLTKDGKLPNDYKLHFINGRLEFIYCSIDREGKNYRNIYDSEWRPLNFTWIPKSTFKGEIRGPEVEAPETLEKMKYIGSEIAKLFDYVRVDFYDVDGKLFYGEITLHHGGGFDIFIPEEYDYIYGEKLKLSHE